MTYVPTSYHTTGTYSTADCIYSINLIVRIRIPSLCRLLLSVPYVVIPSKSCHLPCVRKGSCFSVSHLHCPWYLISERNLWHLHKHWHLHRYVNPIALDRYVQQGKLRMARSFWFSSSELAGNIMQVLNFDGYRHQWHTFHSSCTYSGLCLKLYSYFSTSWRRKMWVIRFPSLYWNGLASICVQRTLEETSLWVFEQMPILGSFWHIS